MHNQSAVKEIAVGIQVAKHLEQHKTMLETTV
jgi:hypothetical protein